MKRFWLPFPPAQLNPNKRLHWTKRAPIAKTYRHDCCILAKCAGKPKHFNLTLTYCPPDKRKRDDDNMIAAFKSGRDGLADAWGVDDNIFNFTRVVGKPVKGGGVYVEYTEGVA